MGANYFFFRCRLPPVLGKLPVCDIGEDVAETEDGRSPFDVAGEDMTSGVLALANRCVPLCGFDGVMGAGASVAGFERGEEGAGV